MSGVSSVGNDSIPAQRKRLNLSSNPTGNNNNGSQAIPIGQSNTGHISGTSFSGTGGSTCTSRDELKGLDLNNLPQNEILGTLTGTQFDNANVFVKHKKVGSVQIYKAFTQCAKGEMIAHYYIMESSQFYEVDAEGNKINGNPISPNKMRDNLVSANKIKESFNNRAAAEKSLGVSGDRVYRELLGYTDSDIQKRIGKAMDAINENNVVPFLKDYYKASGYSPKGNNNSYRRSKHGLIERTENKHDNNGENISMAQQKKVISSLLKAAENCGLENTEEYRAVNSLYTDYTEGIYSGKTDFRGHSRKGSWARNLKNKAESILIGAGALGIVGGICAIAGATILGLTAWPLVGVAALVGAIGGLVADEAFHGAGGGWYKESDSEKLDKSMYALYQKIIEKTGDAEQAN